MDDRVILGVGVGRAKKEVDRQGTNEEPDVLLEKQRPQERDDVTGGGAPIRLVLGRWRDPESLA